jgi:hypothetical protein
MLESIISQLEVTGDVPPDSFFTYFQVQCEDQSIHVESVGGISFPITPKLAKTLIVEAEPARYGLKDKTLLNANVRDTWEIPKERVQTEPSWDQQINKALLRVQTDLNLPEDGVLKAELHNLLIYMPGQFFKAHQDSEKAEGMLATLVVILPSDFTGGELVIDQHGDRRVIEFNENKTNSATLVAFYSDCYHEVKEVKTGYRVALTYNLFFHPGSEPLKANPNAALEEEIKNYFLRDSDSVPWLVYLLDHDYTQNSLDWNYLRGLDRIRVSQFISCADRMGLTAHLALADIHETWSTADEDWSYRSRSRRFKYNDDYEEEDGESHRDLSSEHCLEDMIENEIVLKHWVARSGIKFSEREKRVPKQMICWTKATDEFDPINSEYQGYMGNWGNTLDRWYHRAAIVLWPKDADIVNTFLCNKTEAILDIQQILKDDFNLGLQAVKKILPYWPKRMDHILNSSFVLEFSRSVKDQESVSIIIKSLGIKTLEIKNLPILFELTSSFGADWMISIFKDWQNNKSWGDPSEILTELPNLVEAIEPRFKKWSHIILTDQLSFIIKDDLREMQNYSKKLIKQKIPRRVQNAKILLRAIRIGNELAMHDQFIRHLLTHSELYSEVALVDLIISFQDSNYKSILSELSYKLEILIAEPRIEGDWSIREKTPHNCDDCRELKSFLESSSRYQFMWPMAEARRRHIHNVIESMDIPVTHETLRKGSPYKLVLTKTKELFTNENSQRESIKACLAKMKGV